jgi:hypothetical protein
LFFCVLVAIAVLCYGYVTEELGKVSDQALIRVIESAALRYISDQAGEPESVTLATEVVDEHSALAPYLNLPVTVPGTKKGTYSVTIERNRKITIFRTP